MKSFGLRILLTFLTLVLPLMLTGCLSSNPQDAWTEPAYIKNLFVWTGSSWTPVSGYVSSAYGNLWQESPAGTAITCTVAGTFYKWATTTAGDAYLTTPSSVTNNITVNSAGEYLINQSTSCQSSRGSAVVHWAIFVNDNEKLNIESEHTHPNPGEVMSAGATGVLHLAPNDVVDLRVSSTLNSTTITLQHASLTLSRIGY